MTKEHILLQAPEYAAHIRQPHALKEIIGVKAKEHKREEIIFKFHLLLSK
jgi:hypothetical protein